MINVALIADNHFHFTPSGKVYVNGTYTINYLRRFTGTFDNIVVICRSIDDKDENQADKLRESGGERVTFCKIEDFYGVKNYFIKKHKIRKCIYRCFKHVDAVFVRMPCILSTIAIRCAKRAHIPIIIDLAADPESIYKSATPTFFEHIISQYLSRFCKRICLLANGVSYVTSYVLQQKYPCRAIIAGENNKYFTASISNVDIPSDFYYRNRDYSILNKQIRLLHISNNIIRNSGKGHLECLKILKLLHERGIDSRLTFVGDGDGKDELIKIAESYGVINNVFFTGRIGDRNKYRDIIIDNDIFVFPSHSEGLPRSVLEIMSTGMICVASNVDGIPEILSKDDIFNYDDIDGFTNRICEYSLNDELRKRTSKRNYLVSLNYSNDKIQKAYSTFYKKVLDLVKQDDDDKSLVD